MPKERAMMGSPNYVLGTSARERRRLTLQGELYREPTRYLLEQAGIRPGMRVLDAGCGVGDVTIELAKLVGPDGAVIGVDAEADALAMAEQRLQALGLLNVTFMQAVLPEVALDEPVDAVAGRLIVVHLDDPVQTIRSLSELIRPDGVVTLQDFNNSGATSAPPIPLYRWAIALMRDALKAVGRDPDTAARCRRSSSRPATRTRLWAVCRP